MSALPDRLTTLAERCLSIVESIDPDRAELARDAIEVGEPDIAIGEALGIAYRSGRHDLRFPPEVRELAADPSWRAIHPYLGMLQQQS